MPPLAAQNPGDRADREPRGIRRSGALFAEGARKAHPSFAVTDGNAELVARICNQLDGLPWRWSSRPPAADALGGADRDPGINRLGWLTGRPRTATPRQQTLRASSTGAASLSGDEQCRRGSLHGQFALDAVERVCVGDGDVRLLLLCVACRSLVSRELGPTFASLRPCAITRLKSWPRRARPTQYTVPPIAKRCLPRRSPSEPLRISRRSPERK